MSQPQTPTADTVSLPAAEVKQAFLAADAGLRKYAAENEALRKQVAELTQKQAADQEAVKTAAAAAVKALVDHKIIRPDEAKTAEDLVSTLPGALGVLAKTAGVVVAPKAMGKPEPRTGKQASAGPVERGARMNEVPAARQEVDDNYLAMLGIGN